MNDMISDMQENNIGEVVSLFSSAFVDTEFHKYISPDASERRSFMEETFFFRVREGSGKNEIKILVQDEKIIAAAVWIPPHHHNESGVGGGLIDVVKNFSPGTRERFTKFYNNMQNENKKYIPSSAWHLSPVAVLPQFQGKGLVSLLLKEKFTRLDAKNEPCALATQSGTNEAYYRKHGFITLNRTEILKDKIFHYTMLRRKN